jgi:hypothetical protein
MHNGARRLVSLGSLALVLGMVAAGCASSPSGGGGNEGRIQLDVLSGDEVRATGAGNLWDALRQLRPLWLRARGAATSLIDSPEVRLVPGAVRFSDEPIVYVQGIRHGPIRSLQNMNIDRVRRVEYLDGRDATTRFGTGHGAGVIMVDLDRS